MRKYRVLHFVPGFDHGGIESRLLDWYQEIDRSKFQFDIIKTTKNDENTLLYNFKSIGGEVYTLPSFSPKNYFNFMMELNKIFKNNKYDAVHCHSPTTGKFILKMAKKYNVTVRIMHARTNAFDKSSSFLLYRKYLKKKTIKYANVYLACSQSAGEWMYGRKKKFEIIKNGIFVDDFKFNERMRLKIRRELHINDSLVLGYVSRFSKSKNHNFLLKILKYIDGLEKDVKLILIGDGPEKEWIIKEIKNLNLEENIILLGKINDVENFYQAMDFFVFPSEYEGFGTVAIEAQASGLKTFVSNGVPTDVDITDLIYRIPLTEGASTWAKEIMNNYKYPRDNTSEIIRRAGYDVEDTVRILEDIYSGRFNYLEIN